jgi:hypothetical protein
MRLVAGIRQYRLDSGHTLFDVSARRRLGHSQTGDSLNRRSRTGRAGLEPTDEIRGLQNASERIVLEQ